MNEHLTLACDADGVITDFEGLVCKINGVSDMSQLRRGQTWASVGHYDKTVAPFFESLEKMPHADRLMDFIRQNFVNHYILTAAGYTPRNGPQQKRNWFAREYGRDLVVHVVTGSVDKAQYATPRTILVDDRSKSIDPWVAAGGIGILHKSVDQTIAELQRIIEQFREEGAARLVR